MKFYDCKSKISQSKYNSWGGILGKLLEEFLSERPKKPLNFTTKIQTSMKRKHTQSVENSTKI